MSVTLQLLKLFRLIKQLRGLRSRLDGAEKFLAQQKAQLKEIDDKKNLSGAADQAAPATQGNDEGEAARIELRINTLRDQMNSMKTAKEYSAAVNELNNYKEAKTKSEESALEAMTKIEQLEGQLAEQKKQRDDRNKLVGPGRHRPGGAGVGDQGSARRTQSAAGRDGPGGSRRTPSIFSRG